MLPQQHSCWLCGLPRINRCRSVRKPLSTAQVSWVYHMPAMALHSPSFPLSPNPYFQIFAREISTLLHAGGVRQATQTLYLRTRLRFLLPQRSQAQCGFAMCALRSVRALSQLLFFGTAGWGDSHLQSGRCRRTSRLPDCQRQSDHNHKEFGGRSAAGAEFQCTA